MATQNQIDALLSAVANVNDGMQQLGAARGRFEGYKAEKQRFDDLATDEKANIQTLITAQEANLRALAAQIAIVYP